MLDKLPVVPDYAMGLLGRLIVDGHEDAPGFEATKSRDVKFLFDAGLVQIEKSDRPSPTIRIALTEKGKKLREEMMHVFITEYFPKLLKTMQ